MKKRLLTLSGCVAVVIAVLLACTKKENNGIAVGYASQSSTGGNPNTGVTTGSTTATTGTAGTTGTTGTTGNTTGTTGSTTGNTTGTTGSTTGTTGTTGSTTGTTPSNNNYTCNGVNYSGVYFDNTIYCSSPTNFYCSSLDALLSTVCQVTFSNNCTSKPAPGNYTINAIGIPTTGTCALTLNLGAAGSWVAQSGTVTVTSTNGKLKVSFTNVPVKKSTGATSTASGVIAE